MINWKKLGAGEYQSEDKRFKMMKSWDRIYGNHWILHDYNEENYYKGDYHEQTLRLQGKSGGSIENERIPYSNLVQYVILV